MAYAFWVCKVGSQDFTTHFLNEALSQDVMHINDLPFLGHTHVVLGILSLCVAHQSSYLTQILPFLFFLQVIFEGFQ
jgi:hypothetical protein